MVVDMEVDMVAVMEVDKVVGMVADMEVDKVVIKVCLSLTFLRPNFFMPRLSLDCASSKLCVFIIYSTRGYQNPG